MVLSPIPTITKMKRTLFLLILLNNYWIISAQDTQKMTTNKINFHSSYSRFPLQQTGNTTPNLRIDSEYNFYKFVGAGIYLGAGKSANDHKIDRFSASYYYYGIQSTLHLLPFIQKTDKSRFDLFVPVKVGRCFQNYREYKSKWWDFSAGLGITYYFSRKMGVYTEANYIISSNNFVKDLAKSPVELRFGLSMKIK